MLAYPHTTLGPYHTSGLEPDAGSSGRTANALHREHAAAAQREHSGRVAST